MAVHGSMLYLPLGGDPAHVYWTQSDRCVHWACPKLSLSGAADTEDQAKEDAKRAIKCCQVPRE
jgi:hypothetical protein